MSVQTAKSVEDVLAWVESNAHHRAAWIGPRDAETHLVLSGAGATLRIPTAIQIETKNLIEPGKQFDTRMFRATKAGRARLRKATPKGGDKGDGNG